MNNDRWFWLSFAGKEGNRGVVILPVSETAIEFIDILDPTDRIELLRSRGQEVDVPFYTAVQIATFADLNPGGEVQGWDVTQWIDEIPQDKRCKLLSRDDIEGLGGKTWA
jgi:hypothetical protein